MTAEHGPKGSFSSHDGWIRLQINNAVSRCHFAVHRWRRICQENLERNVNSASKVSEPWIQGFKEQCVLPPRSLPPPMCLLHICSWSCLMVYRSNWFNWAASRCDCAWRNKCSIILRSVYGSQCYWSSVGFWVSGVWRSFCILAFFCIINKYVI